MFPVIILLSLSLLLREATCIFMIGQRGDVTGCITYMFSGALPSLIDSLCVSPRLFSNGLFRETSFATGKRPVHPRTFHSLYNRESRQIIIILLLGRRNSVSSRISHSCQKLTIPATEPSGFSPTASFHRVIARHSFPQLRVSAVLPSLPSRDFSGSFGLVGY